MAEAGATESIQSSQPDQAHDPNTIPPEAKQKLQNEINEATKKASEYFSSEKAKKDMEESRAADQGKLANTRARLAALLKRGQKPH